MSADTLPLDDPAEDAPTAVSDTLLYVPGAAEGTTQWRAEQIQLVNWGGFDGFTTVDVHPGATLLSGASGTGKSTLLDAYTALMMPTDVPFNGASNAAAGRSRGPGQRSLVSYLRGQTDTTGGYDGDEEAEVLRGMETSTWGGVAVTFVSDHGAAFTAARLYWVPVSARMDGEVQRRMLTFDGRLDLRDFEQFRSDAFPPAKLTAHTPGLVNHLSYQAFAARLFTRLGIGANGDGDKALHLLAMVQSSPQIRTVDALYKDMVLERPATYAAADKALDHFDALAETYRRMQDEHRKLQILEPILEAHRRLQDAQETIERVDAFGVAAAGPSPLTLWSLRREADMVDAAAEALRTDHAAAAGKASAAEREHQRLDGDLRTVRTEHDRAGGGDLHALAAQIDNAEQEVATRQLALEDLTARLGAVLPPGADLSDRDVFTALITDSEAALAQHPARHAALTEQLEALAPRRYQLADTLRQVREELADLEHRTSRVPSPLLRLREQVCAATGIAEEDLPFLAELVDVRPEHEKWRTAIETVLAGPARRMLVPEHRFEEFSRAIDPLRLRGRLHFDAATADLPDAAPSAPDTVAGKVVVKDGPFRGWVTRVLAERNATCVASTADLRGPGLRVTAAGQIRRDRSGSHGRADERNVLGFSNTDLVEELAARRGTLDGQLQQLEVEDTALRGEQQGLQDRRDAFLRLSGVTFYSIDVRGARGHVADLTATREQILASNDVLAGLQARMADLQDEVATQYKAAVLLRDRADTLEQQWSALVDRKDTLTDRVIDLEDRQQVLLTDEQSTALEEHLRAAVGQGDPDDLDQWGVHLAHLRDRLLGAQDRARGEETRARNELERTFAVYLEAFETANLTPTLGCYADFAAILAEVQAVGLHARRAEWRQRVMDWSGQDLVPLAQAMQTAVDEIAGRLRPINHILAQLPFGAGQDRLGMQMRQLHRDEVTAFRRQLKKLSSGATLTLDEAQMHARFRELETFMAQLRGKTDPRRDPGTVSVRDDLLDVRRHVAIRAERRSTTGELLSTYTSLGSKSGGETQELIAFIVGAALRYRLGDEERARPRFAPVFLDEGFIKADAEFASRAVRAWTGLGFQLIVGAPLDKVAALEPHMDAFVLVTKNQTTKRSRVRVITDAERAEVRRHGADR